MTKYLAFLLVFIVGDFAFLECCKDGIMTIWRIWQEKVWSWVILVGLS
jgi:hypothetical protein